MIAGYVDSELHVYCRHCWGRRPDQQSCPHLILDPAKEAGDLDEYWITDVCVGCGEEIRYQSCHLLGPVPWRGD